MRLDNDLNDSDSQEREISLGTATILGIFLALALVCAAFFGFGYSLGRHSNPPVAAVAAEAKPDKTDSPFSDFKSPVKSHNTDDAEDSKADAPSPNIALTEKSTEQVAASQEKPKTPTVVHPVTFPVPPQPTTSTASPTISAGQSIVQVSATSRQGDAESLIAALKSKGYTAAIRQESQDKLFHVQLGPFATKKEADAMRQRLDTDGYKAIVK